MQEEEEEEGERMDHAANCLFTNRRATKVVLRYDQWAATEADPSSFMPLFAKTLLARLIVCGIIIRSNAPHPRNSFRPLRGTRFASNPPHLKLALRSLAPRIYVARHCAASTGR